MQDSKYFPSQTHEIGAADEKYQKIRNARKKIDEIIAKYRGRSFVFRGESRGYKDDKEIVFSTLYREWSKQRKEINTDDCIEHPSSFIGKMRELVNQAEKHFPSRTSEIGKWTEFRHQGGASALIDFTYDLHIALFFACNGDFGKSGRLILVDKSKTEKVDDLEEIDPSKIYLIEPVGKSPRVIFQSSVFVCCDCGYLGKGNNDYIEEIAIEQQFKEDMLYYLSEVHAISLDTIYNDLQGFLQRNINIFDIHFYQAKGNSYQREGNYEEAAKHYSKELEINPEFSEAYRNRGNAQSALGRFKEAIKDYDKALKNNLKSAEVYFDRGNAKAALEQHKEAITDYDKALEINPNFADAYVNRGIAKATLGSHKEAIKDYDKALKINPNFAEVYVNRGIAKAALGSHKEAIEDYDKVLEINPQLAVAYNNRGGARGTLGQYKDAITDFDKALEINPQYAEAYHNRGILGMALRQHEEAIEDFGKALEINPQNAAAYNNRGSARGTLGQYKDAITDFDKALEINPQDADVYNNRGSARGALRQYKDAIIDFDKALKINPQDAAAYYNRGIAGMELGQHEEAIEDFEKALELCRQEGNDDKVRAIEEMLKQLKGKQQDASAKEDS